jgi:tetratricopeptide (TPR) repeat protein
VLASQARADDRRDCRTETDPDRVIAACTRLIQSIGPPGADDARVFVNRGLGYAEAHDPAKAIADFTEAIRLDPEETDAYYQRARAFHGVAEYDRALADIDIVLGADPTDADAYDVRGTVLADTLRYQEAAEMFLKAVKLDRDSKFHHNNLAAAQIELSQCRSALAEVDAALQLEPEYGYAIVTRGVALACLGERDKAMAEFDRARRLYPKSASIANAIAWELSKSDQPGFRGDEFPLQVAQHAVELDDTFAYRDTLAAALANVGRYDEAMAEEQRAMDMVVAKGKPGFLVEFKRRLAVYQQKQPLSE